MLAGNAGSGEDVREQGPAVDMDAHLGAVEAEQLQGLDGGHHDFRFSHDGRFSHHIQVPLVMLAFAAAGHALVPEALGDGEPFEWEGQFVLLRHNHPGEGGGHFCTERQLPVAFILEPINLILDFLAAFAFEQLEAFHDAGVVLVEPEPARGRGPGFENGATERHVVRIEIPHAAGWGETDGICHGITAVSKRLLSSLCRV